MTEGVIVVSILTLSIYDLVVYLIFGYNATITAVVRRWDADYPAFGKLAMLGSKVE